MLEFIVWWYNKYANLIVTNEEEGVFAHITKLAALVAQIDKNVTLQVYPYYCTLGVDCIDNDLEILDRICDTNLLKILVENKNPYSMSDDDAFNFKLKLQAYGNDAVDLHLRTLWLDNAKIFNVDNQIDLDYQNYILENYPTYKIILQD